MEEQNPSPRWSCPHWRADSAHGRARGAAGQAGSGCELWGYKPPQGHGHAGKLSLVWWVPWRSWLSYCRFRSSFTGDFLSRFLHLIRELSSARKCCNMCVHGWNLHPPAPAAGSPSCPPPGYSFPHQVSMAKGTNQKTHMRVGKDGDKRCALSWDEHAPSCLQGPGNQQQQVFLAHCPWSIRAPGNAKMMDWISIDWECNFLWIQPSHLSLPCSFSCCFRDSSSGYF